MKFRRLLVCLVLMAMSSFAHACQDGFYSKWGACWPNSHKVISSVPTNPGSVLPDIINVGGAVVHANLGELSQAIGKTIIDTCIDCGFTENLMVSPGDKPFIEAMVGRGFIEFTLTGSPYLVTADAAESVARREPLLDDPHESATPSTTKPVPRKSQVFVASDASCLAVSSKGTVVAGWSDVPYISMKSQPNSKSSLLRADLRPGDTMEVTSTNSGCPVLSKKVIEQHYASSVNLVYVSTKVVPANVSTMMVFFVNGTAAK